AIKEIWVGIIDVGEVRAFARIEHLTVNADGRRATALGSLDHAVGGRNKCAVRRVDNRMLGNHNQRIIEIPYGTKQVVSRVQRVEVEGQRRAGGDTDTVEQVHRIIRIGGIRVRDRLELNHPDPRAGQGRIRIHEYSEHDVVVRIDPEHHAIAEGRVGKEANGASVDRTKPGRDTAGGNTGVSRQRVPIAVDEAEAGDGTTRNRDEGAGALRHAVISREGRAEAQSSCSKAVEQSVVESG